MRATIDKTGVLMIYAETELEAFALRVWKDGGAGTMFGIEDDPNGLVPLVLSARAVPLEQMRQEDG